MLGSADSYLGHSKLRYELSRRFCVWSQSVGVVQVWSVDTRTILRRGAFTQFRRVVVSKGGSAHGRIQLLSLARWNELAGLDGEC